MTPTRFFTGFSAFLIVLYLAGAAFPSHYNWGFHYFAFFPQTWTLAALLAVVAIFVPAVRRFILSRLSKFAAWAGTLPSITLFLGLLGFWGAVMFLFPAKLHLLGDSEIILQLTPDLLTKGDLSGNFRNQPLTYQALRGVQWAVGGGEAVEPITLYRITDGLAGVVYLWVIFFFLRTLRKDGQSALDILLLGILLLFRTGSQFFFGYVENYMFFYVFLTAFIVTGWLSLEKKVPVWLPVVIMLLVPGFHIAAVIFLPSLLLLFLTDWKTQKKYVLPVAGAIVVTLTAGVLALGPKWVLTRIGDALKYDFLPLFSARSGIPYGILSEVHLIDWLNANLHIAPFGLVCVAAGMAFLPRKDYLGEPVFRFLGLTSLIGMVMSFVIMPGLGMARDWDMLSNFFIPLRFLMLYFFILFLRNKEVRQVALVLGVFTLVHWFAWIGINSDEERHIARAEMLTVPELSGTFPTLYYEHLGETFFERRDFGKAARWYEEYLKIDSMHPRILGNLSDCYRELGDRENVFRMLELSVKAQSKNPGVYSNLAVEYIERKDTTRAMTLLKEARLDPAMSIARANLCLLSMRLKDYAGARRYGTEAIRLGMKEPVLYKETGFANYYLKDYSAAVAMFKEYLKAAPADRQVKELYASLQKKLGMEPPANNTGTIR